MATFENLRDHHYINLSTFRRDATAVPTTVWFALHGGKLTVLTSGASGKIKRIRYRTDVLVAPATRRGTAIGPAQAGRARTLPISDSPSYRALAKKYGWLFRATRLYERLRGIHNVLVEVEPV